jgi:hypothetical protein
MDDLRFFHHFIFKAYPALPIDGDAIWRDIAQISHDVSIAVSNSGLADVSHG